MNDEVVSSSMEEVKQSDATILDELTRAYILERYGGKRSNSDRRAYLRRWVPVLVKRLTNRKSKRTA